MPPKRITVEKASAPRGRAPKGYARATFDAVTAEENQSVVRSVALFGVRWRTYIYSIRMHC